jgi:hypothetical protein
MSFNVLPFGGRAADPSPPAGAAAPGACGELVELSARRTTAVQIPAHVLEEVDAAAELWHELRDQSREVRFDDDPSTGRVDASLRSLDGGVVRRLPLRELPGPRGEGPQTAA